MKPSKKSQGPDSAWAIRSFPELDWTGRSGRVRATDLSGEGPDTGIKKPRLKAWNLALVGALISQMTVKRGLESSGSFIFSLL